MVGRSRQHLRDGKSVVVLNIGGPVRFLDTETGKLKYVIRPINGEVWNDCCLSPQSYLLAVGGKSRTGVLGCVELWDLDGAAGSTGAGTAAELSIHVRPEDRVPVFSPPTFPLRFQLASDMARDLQQVLFSRSQGEVKHSADHREATHDASRVPQGKTMDVRPSANNRKVTVTAPPDVMTRVRTFITVTDWPDKITRGPNFEYPRDTVLHAARSFFYACAIEDAEEVFSKLLSLQALAELKGDTKSKQYHEYLIGGAPDPAWEKPLRGDWPGKKEAIKRLVREWNRYPLSRITEDSGVAIGFGVKHFCTVAFDGAPKDFYTITVEPDRAKSGMNQHSFSISTLPPWWGPPKVIEDKRSGGPARSMFLGGWMVTDRDLERLQGLAQLESLSLANAQVTDAGMERLKGLTNLRSLDLTFTKVTDAGFSAP